MPAKRTLHDVGTMHTNAPARGRKRFQFDLRIASQTVLQGVEVHGLRLISVEPADEEGSFDCSIAHADGSLLATLTILVSDTSEYPSDHSFFCSSQDPLPAQILRVTESVHEQGSLSIQDLLMRLLERLAKRVVEAAHKSDDSEDDSEAQDDDDDDDDDGYDLDDEIGLLGPKPENSRLDRAQLRRDFNEVVAYGYRPGLVPMGIDDFALTVSIPVKSLADTIPARALMAWDKRLLSRAQHLTLLISGLRGLHPIVHADATYTQSAHFFGAIPQFRVGLTVGYKLTREDATETLRRFGLKDQYDLDPVEEADRDEDSIFGDDDSDIDQEVAVEEDVPPKSEQGSVSGFRPFSLSSSLESLLDSHFLRILQLRIQYELGWAGAETLWWEVEASQISVEDVMRVKGEVIRSADVADKELSKTYNIPPDPLLGHDMDETINLPLLAFSYLMRRLTLCPRYCLVCHRQLQEDLDALKPFVCNSKLCTYQYYSLNRGPSLEYEICANPVTVDLLVSLAYIAAAEGVLDGPLPIGMGLRVPPLPANASPDTLSPDSFHDFDQLNIDHMRMSIKMLIDTLPSIASMKTHLEQRRRSGLAKPKLQDIDRSIPDAAWSVLRWCVASCTAHIEELQDEDEQIKNIGPDWRQFRFSVGAPDAEAKFRQAVRQAQTENNQARRFPSLYAFHGSAVRNWHSIIRHGLWFKQIAHGRAYGNGVYFAKEGSVSVASYAGAANSCWRKSAARVVSCVALAEIVNLPNQFVSASPFFVVNKTEWIMCRYLMIKSNSSTSTSTSPTQLNPFQSVPTQPNGTNGVEAAEVIDLTIPFVPLDPTHPLTLNQKRIQIPDPSHALEKILAERCEEYLPVDYDDVDLNIFSDTSGALPVPLAAAAAARAPDDWQHDRAWVEECMTHLIPPPTESSLQATTSLQRELKAMLKEQQAAKSLRDLGWYLPEELVGDNLYQWIVELHSFDGSLPIARDLEKHGVNSLVFEIRFPAGFPHAPPFFRILKPRFLPFSQGGGGHITLGGSMCMDLLTADGWLPSYSISAILLQIKLAISNLDPRPARLSPAWESAYGMQEALDGYKRVAITHGWKIPQNIDRIVA